MPRPPLNALAVKEVRRQLIKSPGMLLYPDAMVIHPSWFYNRDGSRMDLDRRQKRVEAIGRLINIRQMKFSRRVQQLANAAADHREEFIAGIFNEVQKDNDN